MGRPDRSPIKRLQGLSQSADMPLDDVPSVGVILPPHPEMMNGEREERA